MSPDGARRTAVLAAALAAAVGAAGCGDGVTGLGPEFQPSAVARQIESLAAAGESNVAVNHIALVGDAIAAHAGGDAAAWTGRAPLELLGSGPLEAAPAAAALARQRSPAVRLAGGAVALTAADGPILPSALLGKTLVLRPMKGYQVDADRSDAPPDGVRFGLYKLDPVTRRPRLMPPEPAGSLDVVDGSLSGPSRLTVGGAKSSGVALLDFSVEGSASLTAEELISRFTGEGSVLHGRRAVEFQATDDLALTEGFERLELRVLRDISVAGEDLRVRMELQGEATAAAPEAATLALVLSVSQGPHEAVLDVSAVGDFVQGTLSYDGTEQVVVGGLFGRPDFFRADGGVLTDAERLGVERIWEGVDALLEFGAPMFGPLVDLMAS